MLSEKDILNMLVDIEKAIQDPQPPITEELQRKIDQIINLLRAGRLVITKDRSIAIWKDTSERKFNLGSLIPIDSLVKERKQVFISYRRDDSGDIAGRIYEYLAKAFGEDAIFFDVLKSIPYGQDFEKSIEEAISQVKVMLVVIGKSWADIRDSEGNRRLDQQEDWIRKEVEAGLTRGDVLPIIPVFVQNASVHRDQLPVSLQPLLKRNGMPIRREPDFKTDISRLIEAINTCGVLPYRAAGPINERPYQIWDYRITPTDAWPYYLIEEPQSIKNNRIEPHFFSSMTRVSLTGDIQIEFEIGNFDQFAQLNLTALTLQVSRTLVDETSNVLAIPPGLGGGRIRRYEVAANYDFSPSAPVEQVLKLRPAKDAGFDYLAISPGEREVVEVGLKVPSPGIYQITPIAIIRNRDSEYKHVFDSMTIAVPYKALIWNETKQGVEPSSTTIVRDNNELQVKGIVEQPCDVPILVQGHIDHTATSIFILYGDTFYTLIRQMHIDNPEPRWSRDGNEIVFHDDVQEPNTCFYSIDLNTGRVKNISEIENDKDGLSFEQKNKLSALVGEIPRIFWSPTREHAALIIPDKTFPSFSRKPGKVVLLDPKTYSLFSVSKEDSICYDFAWSPSGTQYAFLCGQKRMEPNGRYSLDTQEAELWIGGLSIFPRCIVKLSHVSNPSWSPDEKKILLGGVGIRLVELGEPCEVKTLVRYGHFQMLHWKPNSL